MFKKLLTANRGEIACRVIKTAKRLGIETVAIYSDADALALHVQMADEAVHIGPSAAAQSYISIDKVLDAVRSSGADAVHPGYGFLSENKEFAQRLADENIAFIGPPASAIEAMGDKITSKKIASEAGVSTVPGHIGLIDTADDAIAIASEIGFPVMLKASAGGGGKGMRIAWSADEVAEGFQASKNEAAASFGDDRMFIEKFVTQPRHIEIQILADQHGNGIYLGERECSIQRRNQKVIEEAPSPFLDDQTRREMGEQALKLAQAVGYFSAGTVEFIVDGDRNFYFLEMNTRLQVEHPVTELITGIDLVEQMIRVAAGHPLEIDQDHVQLNGWAIESRLYAEDPYRNFLPSTGRLTKYSPPEPIAAGPLQENGKWLESAEAGQIAVRNDTGVYEGGEISIYYDPMIAKLCTWAPDREQAIEAMRHALDRFELAGIGHNLPFVAAVMDHPKFVSGNMTTAFIAEEFPDGFAGVTLDADLVQTIADAAAAMMLKRMMREQQISGQMRSRPVESEPRHFVVSIGAAQYLLSVWSQDAQNGASRAQDVDTYGVCATDLNETEREVRIQWSPGDTLAQIMLPTDEADSATQHLITLKLHQTTQGFEIEYRGARVSVVVQTPRRAELAAQMPEKIPPDTSKMLLCPMPGLVVKIDVEVGQEVQEGQALCTVEAMKMENILRAEKQGKVLKINAEPGSSLSVDDVIMEFE